MPHMTIIPLLAALLLTSGVHAQIAPDPVQPDEQPVATETDVVDEWVEQLDDDDWLMRDLATLELGELDPGITLEMLERYLRRDDLSAEQRARLRLACLRRYAARPKGALGVSFGTIRVGAIEVQPIPPNPDFPASMILRDNDQIALVGERVIDGSFSLRIEILSREPGEILPVTVKRGERVLNLELPLGSFDDLTGAVRMDSELLISALTLRWERLGLIPNRSDSVGDALSVDDWQQAAFPDDTPPDAREPDLHAPRGWVLGPGVPTEIGNGSWTRSSIDVWTDTQNLRDSSSRRAELLGAERAQPLIALRTLIENEREQVRRNLDNAESDQEREVLTEVLSQLTQRLDTIDRNIQRARQPAGEP